VCNRYLIMVEHFRYSIVKKCYWCVSLSIFIDFSEVRVAAKCWDFIIDICYDDSHFCLHNWRWRNGFGLFFSLER